MRCLATFSSLSANSSCVLIAVPAWEAAGGDVEPNSVAGLEHAARSPEVDHVLVRPAGLDQRGRPAATEIPVTGPQDAVRQLHRAAVRIHVAEPGDEIRVPGAGADRCGPAIDAGGDLWSIEALASGYDRRDRGVQRRAAVLLQVPYTVPEISPKVP